MRTSRRPQRLLRLLPLLPALLIAVLAVHAYRAPALDIWGSVYDHVPAHLVSAAAALAAAAGAAALRQHAGDRARRAAAAVVVGWLSVAAAFLVDTVGAVSGRDGDNPVHDAGAVLMLLTGLLVTGAHGWLAASQAAPGRVRALAAVLVVTVPAVPSLGEAGSTFALAVSLAAAVAWALVALVPAPDNLRQGAPPAVRSGAVRGTS